jgi:hypothetical protein
VDSISASQASARHLAHSGPPGNRTPAWNIPAHPLVATTRLMRGSHLAVPEFLVPYGEQGTDADAEFWRPSALCLPVVHATGSAGDVFLCHPFIVHTATWPHRGAGPRMIAQPAVHAADGFAVDGSDPSPVARAIVAGLAMAGLGSGWPGRLRV